MFSGLELLLMEHGIARAMKSFNALSGLSCYGIQDAAYCRTWTFQCPHGLKLLLERAHAEMVELRFNALMGLSCYGKNLQYFKFFMILFMHTCYL